MLRDHWNAPPGASVATGRRAARAVLISTLVGMLSLGAAWAGSSLVPVNDVTGQAGASTADVASKAGRSGAASIEEKIRTFAAESGSFMAGAAKVSMEPRPEAYGGQWETDREACATFEASQAAVEGTATHVADFRVRWAENPNCIYMGGYGIGPMNPITSWSDPYGLWVRSVAMSDGQDTLVMTLIDAIYWEASYNSMCGEIEGGCGWYDLKEQLSSELGIAQDGLMFASTHSHTSPDFIGGWGGVPQWYMQQMTDSIKASVRAAVSNLRPAVLEAGETIVRERNGERRDFYWSAEDDTFSWFRLIDASDQPAPETCTTPAPEPGNNGGGEGNGYGNEGKAPAPEPVCEPSRPGSAIATVGSYAAHPVTADEGAGIADADFPAVFAKKVEDNFGGVGAFFQSGLGNMSPRGNKVEMGEGLASYVPPIGSGRLVQASDLKVKETRWAQPVTNIPLGALGVTGFFDRTFNETPAQVAGGKNGQRPCTSASPISVQTGVTAAKIGSLWITGGPGELFSNMTNTIEERNPNGITLALGLVNDGLGYIVQEFETDHVGRQGTGFVGAPLAEYEDAYSIDHCFGEMTLVNTMATLGSL